MSRFLSILMVYQKPVLGSSRGPKNISSFLIFGFRGWGLGLLGYATVQYDCACVFLQFNDVIILLFIALIMCILEITCISRFDYDKFMPLLSLYSIKNLSMYAVAYLSKFFGNAEIKNKIPLIF
jgi:hypothetical protein